MYNFVYWHMNFIFQNIIYILQIFFFINIRNVNSTFSSLNESIVYNTSDTWHETKATSFYTSSMNTFQVNSHLPTTSTTATATPVAFTTIPHSSSSDNMSGLFQRTTSALRPIYFFLQFNFLGVSSFTRDYTNILVDILNISNKSINISTENISTQNIRKLLSFNNYSNLFVQISDDFSRIQLVNKTMRQIGFNMKIDEKCTILGIPKMIIDYSSITLYQKDIFNIQTTSSIGLPSNLMLGKRNIVSNYPFFLPGVGSENSGGGFISLISIIALLVLLPVAACAFLMYNNQTKSYHVRYPMPRYYYYYQVPVGQ